MKMKAFVGYDFDDLPVYFELKVEKSQYSDSTRLSMDTLTPIREYKKVSLTGYVWDSIRHDWAYGGQIYDDLKIKKYSMPKKDVERILEIWKRYHLNDVNAGTRLQSEIINLWKQNKTAHKNYRSDWYSDACYILSRHYALTDIETNPDIPYEYGSQWLVGIVSDGIIAVLKSIFDENKGDEKQFGCPYEQILKDDNVEISMKCISSKKRYRWLIECEKREANGIMVDFDFYMGLALSHKPKIGEIFSCLFSDAHVSELSIDEIMSDYGCETERAALKIYNQCRETKNKLQELLNRDAFEKLWEMSY